MIQKVLIANRGEIALRIVRACRELGIKTLAVYSEADVQSLHVQLADEAICIGGPKSSDSYLRADRIMSAAEIADVDAIHPGYGFLSENAKFAEQCESCNRKFIGPKSKGERDCSVQRRHQKLIEESPSPFLTPDLRKKMGKAAVRAAEAAEYENAGTIEFLVDAKGNYYFIEMNTRIQVEHPVTEEVTGIDLVKQQIKIANGEKLEFDQSDITFERHAIECRINAEDPARNFAPSPGTIGLYYAPGGLGVRVDSHAYSGYTIPPHYDSMIGKLICSGKTRKEALERTYRALSEYLVRGIKTTIPLHKAIMADPVFIEGKATTAYMEDFLSRTTPDLFS